MTVDESGKIYLTRRTANVGSPATASRYFIGYLHGYLRNAYNADGSYVGPYIGFEIRHTTCRRLEVGGSAVDAKGKIYVAVTYFELCGRTSRGSARETDHRHLSKPAEFRSTKAERSMSPTRATIR